MKSSIPVILGDDHTAPLERVELSKSGGNGGYDEAWLQRLIHRHPECLPMAEIEPGLRRLIPICMELPIKHGFIDNLLMTDEGDIAILETTLWRNPEARRVVVAQAMDYAACLFEMTYSDLENAVKRANFNGKVPPRLYDLIESPEAKPEDAFVDAVNRNLTRGRIVVLVVGDGIKTETERLADALDAHAGLHFTFALVELAVYRVPGDGRRLVVPRTLAKTALIPRGIVEIREGTISFSPPPKTTLPPTGNITAEHFMECMAGVDPGLPSRLRAFLDELAPLGVYPEYQRSLIIKWNPPEGKPVNLGYVMRDDGRVWTDASSWFAPHDLSHAYIEDLAQFLDGKISIPKSEKGKDHWYVTVGGKAPPITMMLDKKDEWRDAMERFIDAMKARLADEPES